MANKSENLDAGSFQAFLLRGNVVDLAVGVVMGAAFSSVVNSIVKDLITPVVAAIIGQADFATLSFTYRHSQFRYGDMINTIVSLVLIALVVYFLVVLPYSRFRALFDKTPDPTSMTKDCAFCFSQIPDRATKCPFCTADLGQSPTKAKSGPSPKST